MAKRSSSEVTKWLKEQEGKFVCQCGCGQVITIKKHHSKFGVPRYLPKHYQKTFYRLYPPPEERFWKFVTKKGNDECWEWTGFKLKGYGRIRARRIPAVKDFAHRLSFLIHTGNLDFDLDVLHTCDNPGCVNPQHLFQGTHAENMADRNRKGRAAKRLTKEDVLKIIEMHKNGVRKCDIARAFNLKRSTSISGILSGKRWAWFTGIRMEA